jgi:hypothetical protein
LTIAPPNCALNPPRAATRLRRIADLGKLDDDMRPVSCLAVVRVLHFARTRVGRVDNALISKAAISSSAGDAG